MKRSIIGTVLLASALLMGCDASQEDGVKAAQDAQAKQDAEAAWAARTAEEAQENDAMDACELAILRAATNRSSVKFKSPHPRPRVTKMPNGQFVVYTKFLAKNGFGSESMSLARCAIASDATTVLDLASADSR